MDLEFELRRLEVEWPPTPAFRLELAPRRRRRRRWVVAVAIAVLAAIAAALAVPQSRGAILRFFHLGAESVQIVETLPPGQERPLDAALGSAVPVSTARQTVGTLLVPPGGEGPVLHLARNVVSMVFRYHGDPVLLSEVQERNGEIFLKKLSAVGTNVRWVPIETGNYGLFLTGRPHIFYFPGAPPRLVGNALVWVEGGVTYRLEGPGLTQAAAVALARSLVRYPGKG